MKPFWRYYGGKWRATRAGAYPQPLYPIIVEPFAGAAGYSTWWGGDREVVLVEKYPTVAAIWRWLIEATPEDVRAIPFVDHVDDLPDWVPAGARALVGFSMNSACVAPRRSLSTWWKDSGRKMCSWRGPVRERVAEQVRHVKRWRVIEGDYRQAPDVEATWFIDPPYQVAGRHYVHGSDGIDYEDLAAWCRTRRGQVIVCEQAGADWLPFRPLGLFKAGPQSSGSAEAVWP